MEVAQRLPDTVGGQAWIGSMWSLEYELVAYALAALLIVGPIKTKPLVPVGTVLIVLTALGFRIAEHDMRWLLAMFAAGMFTYVVSDRLPYSHALAAASLALLVICFLTQMEHVLWPLPLCYFVLWVGATVPARWSPQFDISYGVYLYGDCCTNG